MCGALRVSPIAEGGGDAVAAERPSSQAHVVKKPALCTAPGRELFGKKRSKSSRRSLALFCPFLFLSCGVHFIVHRGARALGGTGIGDDV